MLKNYSAYILRPMVVKENETLILSNSSASFGSWSFTNNGTLPVSPLCTHVEGVNIQVPSPF